MSTIATLAVDLELNSAAFTSGVSSAKGSLSGLRSSLSKTGESMKSAGKSMTMGITAPIVGAIGIAAKLAVEWETAFAGVRKTVDATESEFGILEQQLLDMSKVIPISPEQLAGIAELGGQLGVTVDQIPGFTKTIAMIGVSTNLAGEEAATAIARFINVTKRVAPAGMDMAEQTERIGSTIVDLGNNLATTEADIVNFADRIAGAGSVVGLTQPQILGWAGALSSLGLRAEAGGTAISKVFLNISTAVAEGGEGLETFAKVAGQSTKDFSKAFKKDASKAMVSFIKGLNKIDKAGGNVVGVLTELELGDIRVRDTLLRAAGATDLMTEALDLANIAYEENTALTEEAEKRFATIASMIQTIKNRLKIFAATIGEQVLPVISDLIKSLAPLIEKFTEWVKQNPKMVKIGLILAGIAAAAGPLLFILGTLVTTIAAISTPVLIVVGVLAALGTAFATNFLGIRDILTNVWTNTIKPIFDKIVAIVRAINFSDLAAFPWEDIFPDWLADVVYGIATAIDTLVDAFGEDGLSGLAAAAGKIFSNLWGTLKTNAGTWAGQAMEFLHNVINQGIGLLKEKVGEWIAKFGPAVVSFWDTLKTNAGTWVAKAKDFWDATIKPGIEGLTDKVAEWVEAAKTHVTEFWTLLKAKAPEWVAKATEFWNKVIEPGISALGDKVAGWVTAAKPHVEKFLNDLVEALDTYATANKSTLAGGVSASLSSILSEAISGVKIIDLIPAIYKMESNVVDEIVAQLEVIKADAADKIGEGLAKVILGGILALVGLGPITGAEGKPLGEWILDGLENIIKAIPEMGMLGLITTVGEFIFDVLVAGAKEALTLITGGTEWKQDVLDIGKALVGGVASGMTAHGPTVISDAGIKAVEDSIPLILKGIDAQSPSGLTEEIGVAMGDGIKVGLTSRVTAIVNKAVAAALAIINAVQAALGMGSPSAVFTAIGVNTMTSLANGLNAAATLPIDAMKSMIGQFVKLAKYLSHVFWLVGENDLTAAEKVAGLISSIIGILSDAMAAVDKLKDWTGAEGLGDAILRIMDEMRTSVNKAISLAWSWWTAELERATVVTALIFSLIDLIVPALEAFDKLKDWEPPANLAGQLVTFAKQIGIAMREFAKIAKQSVDWPALAVWAEAVKPAIGVIKSAVDALASLADYKVVAGLGVKIKSVVEQIGLIAIEFKRVAAWRDEWPDLSDFSKAVKNATSPIKSGIDALVALAEFKAVKDVGAKVEMLAGQLGIVALAFKKIDAWREEWPDLSEFASAVNTAVGLIKGPIDALVALADFEPVFNLGEKIRALANQIGIVVLEFKRIAGWREAWGSVSEFALAAIPAMDLMNKALDAFAKMALFGTEFLTPRKFIVFGDIVRFAIEVIVWVANSVGSVAVVAAGKFSVDAKLIFDMMSSAIKFLGDLATTTLPEKEKIIAFIQLLKDILKEFQLGAVTAANIAQNALYIGNALSFAGAVSGFGDPDKGFIDPKSLPGGLPTPFTDWGGVLGKPPTYTGGGGGGGGDLSRTNELLTEIRDLIAEQSDIDPATAFAASDLTQKIDQMVI